MSSKSPLQLQNVIARVPEQISGELDGKAVLLSIENGEYYNMNEVATRIWQLVEKPVAISAIIDRLLSEFEIERDACEAEVLTYLGRLQKDNLLTVQG
jgi:hypothetical protein